MSCGKPHETPCTEVLDRVYGYIDGELDDMDGVKIRSIWMNAAPACASTAWRRRSSAWWPSIAAVTRRPLTCAPRFSSVSGKSRPTIEFAD